MLSFAATVSGRRIRAKPALTRRTESGRVVVGLVTAGQAFAALAFGVTLTVVLSSTAWAQLGGGPLGTTGNITGRRNAAPDKPEIPAPSAIPGAKAIAPAAPLTRPLGDMQPTDALFDAINRGDIATARDALNRGADLNAVNVLGMTPLELSVDLGRNDISFLLLSMRGEDSGRGSRAASHDFPAANPAGKTAQITKRSNPARTASAAQSAKSAQLAAKPVATPKLFANDGGTPLPRAGFLGFELAAGTQ